MVDKTSFDIVENYGNLLEHAFNNVGSENYANFEQIQNRFQCCGLDSYQDWNKTTWLVDLGYDFNHSFQVLAGCCRSLTSQSHDEIPPRCEACRNPLNGQVSHRACRKVANDEVTRKLALYPMPCRQQISQFLKHILNVSKIISLTLAITHVGLQKILHFFKYFCFFYIFSGNLLVFNLLHLYFQSKRRSKKCLATEIINLI